METQSGKRKAEIGLPTSSRQQKRARVHSYTAKWPHIVPSECDDYAFCKVCDDSFFRCTCRWELCNCQSRTHRGIEQTVKTNSSVRELYAPPSKTADSKVVGVTRAEVMLSVSVSWSWNKIFPWPCLVARSRVGTNVSPIAALQTHSYNRL